jgi:allantoicase
MRSFDSAQGKPAFLDLIDLASRRFGASVVDANDEFFGSRESLINPGAPEWREGVYTDRGKWMDGWETRRRRGVTADSHDWCVIRLGVRGRVRGVDVETTHFTGNFPESCAIDVGDGSAWAESLSRTALAGDTHNLIAIADAPPASHVRLRIYPDGGVARLRVYGEAVVDWDRLRRRGEVDLAAAEHGGLVTSCSDMFYGSRHNLIMPGDATHMGDGWETKRRRGPGHDWTIVRLAARGFVLRAEVDTRHFKGNAPGACSLDASNNGVDWTELMPQAALQPDARHSFEDELRSVGEATHVRLNIYPDGGIARLRLFGRPCK